MDGKETDDKMKSELIQYLNDKIALLQTTKHDDWIKLLTDNTQLRSTYRHNGILKESVDAVKYISKDESLYYLCDLALCNAISSNFGLPIVMLEQLRDEVAKLRHGRFAYTEHDEIIGMFDILQDRLRILDLFQRKSIQISVVDVAYHTRIYSKVKHYHYNHDFIILNGIPTQNIQKAMHKSKSYIVEQLIVGIWNLLGKHSLPPLLKGLYKADLELPASPMLEFRILYQYLLMDLISETFEIDKPILREFNLPSNWIHENRTVLLDHLGSEIKKNL